MQMYIVGMWPQRLGIGLALASLALHAWASKARWRWLVALSSWSGALLALTLLSHPMTAVGLGACLVVQAASLALREVVEGRVRRALKPPIALAICLALGLALSAFWWVPLFETSARFHSMPAIKWRLGPRAYLEALRSVGHVNLALIAIGAVAHALSVRRERLSLSAAAVLSGLWMLALSALYPGDGYIGARLSLTFLAFLVASPLGNPSLSLLLSQSSLLLLLATGPDSYSFRALVWRINLSKLLPLTQMFAYSKFTGLARFLMLCASALALSKLLLSARKIGRREYAS